MFSWSLSKGLLCLLFKSSYSVLISYSHCNKSLQTCWKQQEFIPQFCRLEVQCESCWATVKLLAGLCFFFLRKNPFPCCFQLLQLTHDSFLPSSKPAALHFWSFFSSVQSLSCVWLFLTPPPWTIACQASLSITNSWSLPKLMSIDVVMPSNHLILCHPLLLLPSIFPSIRVFSNESVLCIRWPKYWSFSFRISPSKVHS